MSSIFCGILFDVLIPITKESEMVVKKFMENKNAISFDVNLGLGEGFTSFSNSDITSGELQIAPDSSGKNASINFQGVVEISENYMKTIVPYFSIPENLIMVTGIDITISNNDVIECSSVLDFESPVKWSLLGESLSNVNSNSRSKKL